VAAGLLVLTGCGRPAGVDGDLADDWSAFAAPEVPVPAGHACYRPSGDVEPATLGRVSPTVDCGTGTVETIHVGTFSGADATSDHVPADDSAGMRAAYTDCNHQAGDFLGGDWRTGRLELYVTPPPAAYWAAGARWYRCDLVVQTTPGSDRVDNLNGSLRGALTGDRRSARGCVNIAVKDDGIDRVEPADCGQPHSGEFAGIFDAPEGSQPTDNDLVGKGCDQVNAAFVGVDASSMQYRAGRAVWGFMPAAWKQGNRGVQCYLWFDDKPVTGSKRGAGNKGLPIHYG